MGMFDTVHYTCPHCDKIMKIQTKSGACNLKVYHADKDGTTLPPALMCELAEEHADGPPLFLKGQERVEGVAYPGPIKCTFCGEKYVLELYKMPAAVIVPYTGSDEHA